MRHTVVEECAIDAHGPDYWTIPLGAIDSNGHGLWSVVKVGDTIDLLAAFSVKETKQMLGLLVTKIIEQTNDIVVKRSASD